MENFAPAGNVTQLSLLSRYQPLIGVRATERLLRKARKISGLKILHVNSTRQGGGVAEILSSLTPLMNDVGITTEWLVIDGSSAFFAFTKDIHNGFHGEPVEVAPESITLHREVAQANGTESRLCDYDVIIVHDPQPLPLIELRQQQRWIWCCHVDLSAPHQNVWSYLAPSINRYDAAGFLFPSMRSPLPCRRASSCRPLIPSR